MLCTLSCIGRGDVSKIIAQARVDARLVAQTVVAIAPHNRMQVVAVALLVALKQTTRLQIVQRCIEFRLIAKLVENRERVVGIGLRNAARRERSVRSLSGSAL